LQLPVVGYEKKLKLSIKFPSLGMLQRIYQQLQLKQDLKRTGYSLLEIIMSSVITFSFTLFLQFLCYCLRQHRGMKNMILVYIQKLPLVSYYVLKLRKKLVAEIDHASKKKHMANGKRVTLPRVGKDSKKVMVECSRMQLSDSNHTSKMSGAIYVPPNSEMFRLCTNAYNMFAHTNPLHGDAFPSVSRMENDVVSMVASLLGAQDGDDVCGNMTSGGTESILSAIRTARDFMHFKRGITRPEMIVATSAHAAVYKAAEYFNIKLILIGTDREGRLSVSDLMQSLNRNVILVYASAPGYPHGAVDSIEDIASIIKMWGCCLHVDACLGGFILPFAKMANFETSAFDFRIPEVTSISIDTHKYGCAQKGSSVVLYRTRELRKFQFTAVSSWSGGVYISPTQAGSRSGGLIAQTWAVMMHIGYSGYASTALSILQASLLLRKNISLIPELEVIGVDVTMVVAWRSISKEVNIYILNDILSEMGWHLSVLHSPPALHMCITNANTCSLDALVKDLQVAIERVKSGNYDTKEGKAPIYGMANRMSSTSVVNDLLKDIQDVLD
jgi:sphinganine-1-phosphate aldolase